MSGRTSLSTELSRHCSGPDPHWNFVPEAMINQADSPAIESLINARRNSSNPERPEEWALTRRDEQLEYLLYVPPGLRWFRDHFPGNPILPGVVQIDWAIRLGAELGFDARRFSSLPRVKFTAVIVPDSVVRLSLCKVGAQLRFSYHSSTTPHSRGTVSFIE